MSIENTTNHHQDDIKFRQERLNYLLKFFEKISLDKIAGNSEKESSFMQKMSTEEFNSWLIRINGILRDIPTSKRRFIKDPEFVRIFNSEMQQVTYTPPSNSFKEPLLGGAFLAYKRMEANGKNMDASLMLGSSINAIHPFTDGNGRTARFISMMLASSGDDVVLYEPNPSDIQPFIELYMYEKIHNIEDADIEDLRGVSISSSKEMSDIEKQDFFYILENDSETFIKACRIYLKNKNSPDVFLTEPGKKKEFVQSFFNNNKENIKDLIETYNNLKKEYIQTLIDIFENPTKYYLKDIPNIYKHFSEEFKNKLSDKTLKDLFYLANIGGVEKGAKISDLVNNI